MSREENTANDPIIPWASEQAASLLAPLGDRWRHVQGVVKQTERISKILKEEDRLYFIAAAYLHDIGYAPSLIKTGFHPLDGAYYLQAHHQDRLASLVAYHSEAQFEAKLRGLEAELEQFPREYSLVADALTFCDMTTSSTGEHISFEERLTDIINRYDEKDIVIQALHQAMPAWKQAIERIQQALHKLDLISAQKESKSNTSK